MGPVASGYFFEQTVQKVPPAGAGECALPKLLQYAYLHQLKPLAMAEFWWGDSPKNEIRYHGYYYPSCKGKCEPILQHMAFWALDIYFPQWECLNYGAPGEGLAYVESFAVDTSDCQVVVQFGTNDIYQLNDENIDEYVFSEGTARTAFT